jgi:hypothetical protein
MENIGNTLSKSIIMVNYVHIVRLVWKMEKIAQKAISMMDLQEILVVILLDMEFYHLQQKVYLLKLNQNLYNQSTYINEQKEKEESMLQWILLTTQPLSTVTQKAYIEHMHILDPEFIVPEEKKIRMMIARSYGYNKNKLMQFLKSAQSISLTTNLWSSHSKHGYLGIIAIWISQNFEIIDILLEITYFPAPHTAENIARIIKSIIQKWNIEDRVITITTDNSANVMAAICDLAPIKKLSCAAHTLQLAVGKGLKVVGNLSARAKQLIDFFST